MEGGGSSSSSGSGGMMMMGLYGGEYNNNSASDGVTTTTNINGAAGVFCPMMFMTNTCTSTTSNNTSPNSNYHLLHLATGTDAAHHHFSAAARGVNIMDTDGGGFSVRAKITAHPHYPRLLTAYANCQKVGAPPDVVVKLEEACSAAAASGGGAGGGGRGGCIGEDPALDQFMEAYCELLTKYEQELTKPFKEAMIFLQRFEAQFKTLTVSSSVDHSSVMSDGTDPRNGSSEEEVDHANNSFINPLAGDCELKNQLLQKYSGYLGSLKQEFMKKRKKGKLPKEARQQLLDWWSRHYKWPYPSESQKLALAESTGLDQKQINNWFINQRKRHWKPSEDMQFVVMDAAHPHYYLDHVLGNPFSMDMSPSML